MESGRALQSGRQAREQGTDLGGRCPSPSTQDRKRFPGSALKEDSVPSGVTEDPQGLTAPPPWGRAQRPGRVCALPPAFQAQPARAASCVPPTRMVLSRALTGARGKTRPPSSAMTPAHRGAGRVKLVTIYRLYSRAWPGVNPRREFALLGIRDMAERRN